MSGQANFRPEDDRAKDGVFMFEKSLKVIGVVVGVGVVIVAVFAAIRLIRLVESAHGAEAAAPNVAASAPEVWRSTDTSGRTVVRAFPSVRCPVVGGWMTRVFRAERIVDGKTLRACWFGTDDDRITVIDEAGGVSYVPTDSFEQEVPGD